MTNLTQEQADELCDAPKEIRQDLQWKAIDPLRRKIEVPVYVSETGEKLILIAHDNRRGHNFVLKYGTVRIRGYDSSDRHTNPDGVRFDGPHKHVWHDVHEDRVAYEPDDIDPEAVIDDQLLQFFEEENITLIGTLQRHLDI